MFNEFKLIIQNESQYDYTLLKKIIESRHIILYWRDVFRPFPRGQNVWELSKLEEICVYNKEVRKVIDWVYNNIVLELNKLTFEQLTVLLRIATSMLFKCNIDKDYKIQLHTNLTTNCYQEYKNIILNNLPF